MVGAIVATFVIVVVVTTPPPTLICKLEICNVQVALMQLDSHYNRYIEESYINQLMHTNKIQTRHTTSINSTIHDDPSIPWLPSLVC